MGAIVKGTAEVEGHELQEPQLRTCMAKIHPGKNTVVVIFNSSSSPNKSELKHALDV